MKILFIQWNSIGQNDLEEAFLLEGHNLIRAAYSENELYHGDFSEIEKKLFSLVKKEKPDVVFTVDYFPFITDFCDLHNLWYVSWVYDSPHDAMYSTAITNPRNIVYTLDKEVCMEFRQAGVTTVRYLPMAANTDRLDKDTKDLPFIYDVSFIGSLYLENDLFSTISDSLTDYARGYLDALVAAQLQIWGYNFIPESLGPVLEDIRGVYPWKPIDARDIRSDAYFYSQRVVNPWISAVERIDLMDAVAERYGVDCFTYSKDFILPNLRNHGFADYYEKAPKIFKQSKINLNISYRGIKSGVPLRCFDIMGAGGFLLSNFQSGFLDLFIPGEDFIFFENKEDLLQKVGYYLTHEKERQAIAKSGHDKVAASHTYRHRVKEMLDF
ncbi:MAG: glycosyltransferase [Hungatella sp.]|nr:glycosyltransferase [Hungatella sp.]